MLRTDSQNEHCAIVSGATMGLDVERKREEEESLEERLDRLERELSGKR